MKSWVKKLLKNSSCSRTHSSETCELECNLGYRFRDKALLKQALTHSSVVHETNGAEVHNQRLEFLGDAVLSLLLSERLFELFPGEREGTLAKGRSALERGAFLSKLAKQLDLPKFIIMSKSELGAEGQYRPKTLEDALEAIVGAIYLDSNLMKVKKVVLPWYGNLKATVLKLLEDENPKGRLQEIIQSRNPQPTLEYKVSETTGPDHNKQFTASVFIEGDCEGTGQGSSKKKAEEEAAREALLNFETE